MLATLLKGCVKNSDLFQNDTIVLNNPDTSSSTNDYFGYCVALSENYAVIGSPTESDENGTMSGKIYVFNATDGSLVQTFANPNAYGTGDYDYFGRSVAIYDDFIVAGAYNEDEANNTDSGKVYIFSISSGSLIFTINNPNAYGTSAGDVFGIQVSISGNLMIAGAFLEDENFHSNSGKAYIFDVTTGSLLFTLNNPNAYGTANKDYFGWSVAISENYALVGAYQEDDTSGTSSGKVYVFDVTTGLLLHTLNNPNAYGTSYNDYFGYSVAIDGNYALVGAYQEDNGSIDSGKAYIFDVTTGTLLQTLSNPNAYGTGYHDYFGYDVAIDGKYAIIGAHQEDELFNNDSGKAYIFDVTTGTLLQTLSNPNAYGTSASDYFGRNVAICGRKVIVGAHGEDDANGTMSGKAYIFY